MIYISLFYEFLKIGLFAIGGGLATLPFLNKLVEAKAWFTTDELTNMIAISEATPGPLGVNISTYAGFETSGILGALVATFGLVLPSYIIIVIISHFLNKFNENIYVKNIFNFIKPIVTGLILVVFLDIFQVAIIGDFVLLRLVLFSFILFLIFKFKKHPIFYIVIGAILGVVFKLK